jgi:trehalose/maltose hydrolase-like predicted phosphorylase
MSNNPFWHVIYDGYDPGKEPLREALCTLGNGYFATRGASEDASDDQFHYPGTYLAGGYNRLETEIADKVIENEDLVNWPNWLKLKFKPEGGEWFSIDKIKIINYRQKLDLKDGVLKRYIHFEDQEKRETIIESCRLVHMSYEHLAGIQWKFTPKNWSGKITIHSALDGSVINNGVNRYRELNSQHLQVLDKGLFDEEGIYLEVETKQSKVRMGQSARLTAEIEGEMVPVERKTIEEEKYIAQEVTFPVEKNKDVKIEKIIALYTSRDNAISDPLNESKRAIHRAEPFDRLYDAHCKAWEVIWNRVDTDINSEDDQDQLILRLHIFHLYQTASFNTIDLDVGIPSRGWHGEAYRGHILWDELFIFPLLNLSSPELTRALLMYRYRRLPEARYYAKANGYDGAMYPWQSGSNGREESQDIHLNPASGRWVPDDTYLQRHVNSAIVYNIWQYFQVSNDHEFLSYFGGEMILDIAKFWASKATWDAEKEKYVINEVVGPDEYHTGYPNSDRPGINNNAYINVMAIFVFKHALQTLELLDEHRRRELTERLEIQKEDIERWTGIGKNMYIPFLRNGKIISQFEGFEGLQDLDWKKYNKKYGEVLRLDRILEKEEDDVNRYKAVKQADSLMLFYLFSADELTELINYAGYNFNPNHIPDNINYYHNITSHGSTLSKLVFSWVMARSHRSKSWHNFRKALISDFQDIQGGTTSEGIHLGAMAGTVDLIRRCYTGLEIRDDALWLNPQLPRELKYISFRFRYRSHWIMLHITGNELTLISDGGWAFQKVRIMVKDVEFHLKEGKKLVFKYSKDKVELV